MKAEMPCFAAHQKNVESIAEIRKSMKAELLQLRKRIEALNDARKYNALVCLDQVFDLLGYEKDPL